MRILILLCGLLCTFSVAAETGDAPQTPPPHLKAPDDFAQITDAKARSIALFAEATKVITHPRCLNCHPKDERPTQKDSLQPHQPWVVRGSDGHGAPGMRCHTCHHDENFDPAGVPGHPKWALAPASMAWQGKTAGEICSQLLDEKRNGGMDHAELIHHMAEDSLVGWGWAPGSGREPVPGTQAAFGALIRAWIESGAHCPE